MYQIAVRAEEEEEEVESPAEEEQQKEGAVGELDVMETEEERMGRMLREVQAEMMLSVERALEYVRGRRDETGSEGARSEETDVEGNGEEGTVEGEEEAEEAADTDSI